MPLKTPKPKSQQQMEELVELLKKSKDKLRSNCCLNCDIGIALYQCSIDTLSWATGGKPKEFCKMMRRLRRNHGEATKHQCAHAE